MKYVKVENNHRWELSEYVLENPSERMRSSSCTGASTRTQVDAPSCSSASGLFHTRPRAGKSLKRMEHEYSLRAEAGPIMGGFGPSLSPQLKRADDARARETLAVNLSIRPHSGTDGNGRSFLRFAVGLATALSRLHKRGLIHKDIKAAQMFLVNLTATGEVLAHGLWVSLSRLPA